MFPRCSVPRKGSLSQLALAWSCPSDYFLLGTFVIPRLLSILLFDLHFSCFCQWPPLAFVVVPCLPCGSFFAVSLASAGRCSMSRLGAFEPEIVHQQKKPLVQTDGPFHTLICRRTPRQVTSRGLHWGSLPAPDRLYLQLTTSSPDKGCSDEKQLNIG